MKLLLALVGASVLAGAQASCINACSGHGFCGAFDLCTCYGNWAGNDCSGRVCPSTKAWVDTAIDLDDAHNYATCGNKGDCQGKSGECACYEPFEGKGCRRMACPNGCSGHGTCEYIEELALNNVCTWDGLAQGAKTNCVHGSITGLNGGHDSDVYSAGTNGYTGWDRNKIQGCQCDPGWSGIDCSGRICPMGDDPLRTRNEADTYVQQDTTFAITVGYTAGTAFSTADATAPSFVIGFTDTYNEKWYTRPIPLCSNGSSAYLAAYDAGGLCEAALVTNVYNALLDLPNAAITGAAIDPVTGVADSSALTVTATAADDSHIVEINITLKSSHNSGALVNKMSCHHEGCAFVGANNNANPGGCSPKYVGVDQAQAGVECSVENVATNGEGGTTNQDTCSRRGSCDGGSGLCACHEGYTDEDCSMQTVLV